MKKNYSLQLEKTLESLAGTRPRLLLHSCCGPCSSYVLEYLSPYFDITVFYYNPNISPEAEFRFRAKEQQRLLAEMPLAAPVSFLLGEYEPEKFHALAKGHEAEPEGGARCFSCYHLRLSRTAEAAAKGGFGYFTTTLSISPHKNAEVLNAIGKKLAEEYGVPYLFSDFKKKNGYRRSCQLSQEYGLYRQDYCGCAYSKLEAEARKAARAAEGGARP